jgi:tetratricopeptide (TPR) repeat protein
MALSGSRSGVAGFAGPPDPGEARVLDDLIRQLRLLKVWAGDPSYEVITRRVNAEWRAAGRPEREWTAKNTVAACFTLGRRRPNDDLVVGIVAALNPDSAYVERWRQALRIVRGEAEASTFVTVQSALPDDLALFTGRETELARLADLLYQGAGSPVVISAIEGMAGIGKTRLAVHAGHLMVNRYGMERVLFADLRGFDPDPNQPPADPAAVLDGFLRLLGVPGHAIPHDLEGRRRLYRQRLLGRRVLIVLDNAATEDQVDPLLPRTSGSATLITSRRTLSGLSAVEHLRLDVFTSDEAMDFLASAVPGVPVGPDRQAAARIAERCGHLPLALGLVAGYIRATPGWTLTDHADRLDERARDRRLDTDVELALDVSYEHLPPDQRRLLRLAALHPGPDVDAYAAAALAGTHLAAARTRLQQLCRDHLLQQRSPGRYTFHDLVRAYATVRAGDEERPPERRAALTRLFDYYLATTAAAMDTLHPAEAHRRPRIPAPATPAPRLADPDTALAWLDTERTTLVAVAAHTATHGWPTHTTHLSTTLYRYLQGGHLTDASTVYAHALQAARHTNDIASQAHALTSLGITHVHLGRYGSSVDHLQQAVDLFQRAGDMAGKARALRGLGNVQRQLGRYALATDQHRQALILYRQAGDRIGEATVLGNLGVLEERQGRYMSAADHHERALTLHRQTGNRVGEARALNGLGIVELRVGRYKLATEHLRQALTLYRLLGNRDGEAIALSSLGALYSSRGQSAQATQHYQQALTICREIGQRSAEAWVVNGLGEAARTAGQAAAALTHHTDALDIAAEIGDLEQQARAHSGLGHAHHARNDLAEARHHYRRALSLYTDLGLPEAEHTRSRLVTIETELGALNR